MENKLIKYFKGFPKTEAYFLNLAEKVPHSLQETAKKENLTQLSNGFESYYNNKKGKNNEH